MYVGTVILISSSYVSHGSGEVMTVKNYHKRYYKPNTTEIHNVSYNVNALMMMIMIIIIITITVGNVIILHSSVKKIKMNF